MYARSVAKSVTCTGCLVLATRINGVFNQVLQVPAVRTAITEAQAADIVGGTPQQFDAFIKSELKRWPEVVKTAGITPQ